MRVWTDLPLVATARPRMLNNRRRLSKGSVCSYRIYGNAPRFVIGAHYALPCRINCDMAGQPSVRWLVIEWPQFIAINRKSVHLRVIVDLSFLHRVDKSVPRVDRQIRRIAWSNRASQSG